MAYQLNPPLNAWTASYGHGAESGESGLTPLCFSSEELIRLSLKALDLASKTAEVAEVIETWACSGQRQDVILFKELGSVLQHWSQLGLELDYSLPAEFGPDTVMPATRITLGAAPLLTTLRLVMAQGGIVGVIKAGNSGVALDRERLNESMLDFYRQWQLLCAESGFSWAAVLPTGSQSQCTGTVRVGSH